MTWVASRLVARLLLSRSTRDVLDRLAESRSAYIVVAGSARRNRRGGTWLFDASFLRRASTNGSCSTVCTCVLCWCEAEARFVAEEAETLVVNVLQRYEVDGEKDWLANEVEDAEPDTARKMSKW